jgi:large conductance mechanosensitive channel
VGVVIALVIGMASTALVNALVEDIVNPLIGLFLPTGNLSSLTIKVTDLSGGTSVFLVGHLISEVINFVIIALFVFLAYKSLSRLKLVEDKTLEK